MTFNLMPWMILWAVLTTIVIILAIWRLLGGLHELGGIHLATGGQKELEQEVRAVRKLNRIDHWGIGLTVVSAVLILAIGVAFLYNAWVTTSTVIR